MKIGNYIMSNWWHITSTRGKKMDPETKQRKESALKTLLDQLDVPALRKDVTRPGNLRWLQRNLSVRNGGHAMLNTVLTMIRQLQRG